MDKIIVINGKGGIGKDTLIDALKNAAPHYIHVSNVSSIAPIVIIAEETGLHIGREKNPAYRKLLSDLKVAIDDYYLSETGTRYTTSFLFDKVKQWERLCEFGKAKHHVLFVHIREPELIEDFIRGNQFIDTLLITSNREQEQYGNDSDDGVEDFSYRYIFEANGTKEEEAAAFCSLIEKILIGG